MINKLPSGKWRVRVKSKGEVVADQSFDRKGDAEQWEAAQKRALTLGEFVDPKRGKESLGSVADRWMESRSHSVASKTLSVEGHSLHAHLPATLRNKPVSAVRPSDLDALYATMLGSLSRSTVVRFRNTLSSLFGWAERDGLIARNPVVKSQVPRGRGQDAKQELFPFSLPELRSLHTALAAESPEQADVAIALGLTGLRWGELVALRVRDVQSVPNRALRVSRSAPDGQPIRTQTKGGQARSVPLPAELVPIIAARAEGKGPDDLLFSPARGARLNGPNWKRAVKWSAHAGGRRVHDLRHTAATLWLSNGIDPKTVQKWLGHSTMTLTVDTYSHWMGEDADAAAMAKMDVALGDTTGTQPRKLRAAK